MITITGQVQKGCGDFRLRMTAYSEVFRRATGEKLFPGTLNVKVNSNIPVKEDFRILGKHINEPQQDLIFEICRINGFHAYRIRPYNLQTGGGGWGDNVIEIASSQQIPNVGEGSLVQITFLRDDLNHLSSRS